MAKQLMMLQYILSVEDQLIYHKYIMKHDELIKKAIKRNRMIMTVVIIIISLAVTYFQTKGLNYTLFLVVSIASGIVGYAVSSISKLITENGYMKLVTKKIIESSGNRNIAVELSLLKRGLHITTQANQTVLSWNDIVKIEETEQQLLLFMNEISAFIIPKRDIDEGSFKLFQEKLCESMERFKTREAFKNAKK